MRVGSTYKKAPSRRLACVALIVALTGCSESSLPRGRIYGKVTIDGKPMASGQIRFFAISGGVGADGPVKNGVYDIPASSGVTSGKYRVELSSERETGRKVPDMDGGPGDMKNEVVEDVPAKFNRNSSLQVDYDPKQDKPYDFDLKK